MFLSFGVLALVASLLLLLFFFVGSVLFLLLPGSYAPMPIGVNKYLSGTESLVLRQALIVFLQALKTSSCSRVLFAWSAGSCCLAAVVGFCCAVFVFLSILLLDSYAPICPCPEPDKYLSGTGSSWFSQTLIAFLQHPQRQCQGLEPV